MLRFQQYDLLLNLLCKKQYSLELKKSYFDKLFRDNDFLREDVIIQLIEHGVLDSMRYLQRIYLKGNLLFGK